MSDLSILFLFPKRLWDSKMSPARRLYIQGIRDYAGGCGIPVRISGQGWPDWVEGEPAVNACRRILPGVNVVDWYKPLGAGDALPLTAPHLVADAGILTVERFNEAWWPDDRAAQECYRAGTALPICHHANDAMRFRPLYPRVPTIPHCANLDIFGPRDTVSVCYRPIDCLLTGIRSADIYPLRERMARLIESGKIPGRIRRHPGYRVSPTAWERQVQDYAAELRQAKVSLVCSSQWRYALAKYPESMAAGCAIVGDIPNERCEEFRSHVTEVDATMTDAQIIRTVRGLLADPDELQRRADAGRTLAFEKYGMNNYAENYFKTIRQAITFQGRS